MLEISRMLLMRKVMESFTEHLWATIAKDIYPGILKHPFLQGLTSGTLPEEAFRTYICQDSAYLKAYGEGLAILASKSGDAEAFMMFCEHARTTVIVEQALHSAFLDTWEAAAPPPAWHAMSPNGLLYSSYLLRVARERPYHEGLAAFLPCYWIYRRVGQHLTGAGSPHPLYQKWIDTYSGDAFGKVVAEVLQHVETVAATLGEPEKAMMKVHFRRTSQLEYLFWDGAFHQHQWPFPG